MHCIGQNLTFNIFSQGNDHAEGWQNVKKLYVTALIGNWKIWTVPQLVNLSVIPVEFRVLFANLVAFFWNIYLSSKTAKSLKKNE